MIKSMIIIEVSQVNYSNMLLVVYEVLLTKSLKEIAANPTKRLTVIICGDLLEYMKR